MPSSVTPVWTEASTLLAPQQLALASSVRATLDLRTAYGAFLLLKIGRTAATAITGTTEAGVSVIVRRIWNNDAAVVGGNHPVGMPAFLSSIAAVNSTTLNGASASGSQSAVVTSATGFTQGVIALITDTATAFTRAEWVRVSKVSGTTVTFDRPLQVSHNSGDIITTGADVFSPVWMPGGSLIEVLFDSGDDAGPTNGVCVSAHAQIYASDTVP